jgi:hypothetical protein
MDASLPSYEAAMRDSREYLRRRDLSSQDEIPLYFAWQRLYAAANANLSTDFLQETRTELRARQQARLAPRRGVPPPLFTSFDKVNRTSAQASAFLRSGSSSEAAIEMMARRYRREAEKLRSSREKFVGSLDDAETRKKKPKSRQNSPVQEVEELLQAFKRPRMKSKSASSSEHEGKRTMKTTRGKKSSQELDVCIDADALENAETLPQSKVFEPTAKGKGGCPSGKDAFENVLGVDGNTGKAAELRRSSFSSPDPAGISSFSTVANVAAFAARVTDWRMPDGVDAEVSPSKNTPRRASSARKNGLEGASELRGSTLVEAGELDTTFEGSSVEDGASEEDGLNASTASPTSQRRTKRGEANDRSDACEGNATEGSGNGGKGTMNRLSTSTGADLTSVKPPRVLSSTSGDKPSEFRQKLVQLSHAVGDMQVKIQGKQIEVSFKGSLSDEDVAEVDAATESATLSEETKQPSVIKKVLDTALQGRHEVDGAEQEHATAQTTHSATGLNGHRTQSSVRFADTAQSGGKADVDEDPRDTRIKAEVLQPEAASIAHLRREEHSDQRQKGRRDSSARRASSREHTVAEDDSSEETMHKQHVQDLSKQQESRDEFADACSEEGQLDEAALSPTAANPASYRVGARISPRLNKDEYVQNGRLEERRSKAAPFGEQSVFHEGHAGRRSGTWSGTAPGHLASSVLSQAPRQDVAERLDAGGEQFDEHNGRTPRLQRSQDRDASQRRSGEDTINNTSSSDQRARSAKQESRASRTRKDVANGEEAFGDERGSRGSDSRDFDSDFMAKTRGRRHSSRGNAPQALGGRPSSSSREHTVQDRSSLDDRERRRSRNQTEELYSESGSDEDLSDGPDTPHKRHADQRRYPSSRHQPRRSHDAFEYRGRTDSRPMSSRSATSQHEKAYSKARGRSPELSDESDFTDRERREAPSPDTLRRSRSRRSHSYHKPRSPVHSRHESSRRERHFTPATESSRDTKSKRQARSSRVSEKPHKLPEGVLWPPGMEKECIARLGLDGHHPIAPPGLEHLVTKEQWGEYWTWLHWYSSWQMWYMKTGKKPTHKSAKRMHRGHRPPENEDSAERYDKQDSRNANWWVDVGSVKHRHRRDRQGY